MLAGAAELGEPQAGDEWPGAFSAGSRDSAPCAAGRRPHVERAAKRRCKPCFVPAMQPRGDHGDKC